MKTDLLNKQIDPLENKEVSETFKTSIITKGYVNNCELLNIREKPSSESNVLTVVGKLTEVIIDLDDSNDEFYSVNVDGVKGYAMRKFISEGDDNGKHPIID